MIPNHTIYKQKVSQAQAFLVALQLQLRNKGTVSRAMRKYKGRNLVAL